MDLNYLRVWVSLWGCCGLMEQRSKGANTIHHLQGRCYDMVPGDPRAPFLTIQP